ncbi:MAG: hypothetical protein QXL89_03080 [Nitrososphaeria archaeon]
METINKENKSGSVGRRAFLGIAVVGGLAVGFLAGWLSKPAEGVVSTVTSTVTSAVTSTVTQPGATVTAAAEAIVPLRRVTEPKQGYHKVIDYQRCTGCRLCEFTCAVKYQPENFPGVNLEYARIRVHKYPYISFPMFCRYCTLEEWVEGTSKAPCEYVCPTGALQTVKDVKEPGKVGNGYRWVDPAICSGLDNCGRCLEICEEQFGSGIFFAPPDEKGIKRAMVCTMCAGMPECVNACPEQAIRFEPPQQNGRYYAYRPRELAELLYRKFYHLEKVVT